MNKLDLATVFFEEWDHLLRRAERLEANDKHRQDLGREGVHRADIRTITTIAASLERIGAALRDAHYAEEVTR